MKHLLALSAALATSGAALAQTPVVIADPFTNVTGVGFVEVISKFAVNDHGEWVMLVDTLNPNQEIDEAIIRNGFLTLQEGTPLASPPNSSLDAFRSLNIDAEGNIAWELYTQLVPVAFDGLYFNTRKIAFQGDTLDCSAFSPTTTWVRFRGAVKMNDNRQILLSAEVNDPGLSGGRNWALLLMEVDDLGNIVSTTDIAHARGPVPDVAAPVWAQGAAFPTLQSGIDINNRGQVLWQVRVEPNVRVLYLDTQKIAQEGLPSPVPGATWQTLIDVPLDLNDRGDYAFKGDLNTHQSNDGLIIKNGAVYVREFDTFPALEGRRVSANGFGNGMPVYITNGGDVVHYVDATGDIADKGILLGKEWVVRQDVTNVRGVPIDMFPDAADTFTISPGGRFLIFKAELDDTSTVACLVDLGRVTLLDDCGGTSAQLFRSSGFAIAGQTVRLAMDQGQGTGVTPFLFFSNAPSPTYPPCGLPLALGELLIAIGGSNPVHSIVGSPWTGTQPVVLNFAIPNDPALVDTILYAQGAFLDVGDVVPGPPNVLLTNGIEIEIGAP